MASCALQLKKCGPYKSMALFRAPLRRHIPLLLLFLVSLHLFLLARQAVNMVVAKKTLLLLAAAAGSAQQVQVSSQPQERESSSELLVKHLGGSLYATRYPGVTWDNDAWTLTSTNPDNDDWHTQSFVSNGYIGSSFASTGPFPYFFPNSSGWPLFDDRITFGTVAGFFDRQATMNGSNFPWLYQYGGDSAISGLPNWGPLVLDLGNGDYLDGSIDQSELSNVELVQDFRKGHASYSYTWTPKSCTGGGLKISFLAAADKLHVNRAYIQMQITASEDTNATIVNILDGRTAVRTDFVEKGTNGSAIYAAVSPWGVPEVTAWVFAKLDSSDVDLSQLSETANQSFVSRNASTIAQSLPVSLPANKTITVTKYVGIASTDAFGDPANQAYSELQAAVEAGLDKALKEHAQEWSVVMPDNSVTSFSDPTTRILPHNLIERQITNVVALSMLLMNTIGENAFNYVNQAPVNIWGISVCGLTSDCYAGQRFWDEDIWMQPFLAAAHPYPAKQIALSRTSLYSQAKANAQTAFTSSKNQTKFSKDAAAYPWTVGRDGNCTATGPCFDYEYHLNGDIVRSFVNYWAATGDDKFFEETLLPVTNSLATFFSELLQLNSTTNTWALTNMTDPDEYANNVDNGGYTMALIRQTLLTANFFNSHFNKATNENFTKMAYAIDIPSTTNGEISLEYTGMDGSIAVKQADVILNTFPLNDQIDYPVSKQLNDLSYYADKQSPDGPGMTWAIFSIDASAIVPSGCPAYTYDLDAWSPYIRGPWFTFSEQQVDEYDLNGGTNPAYPFLTGFGGFLQMDLFGYLGLRYNTSYVMEVYPNLPPQIPYIKYPVFYYQGWPVDAFSNQTHTTMTRLNTPLTTANQEYASKPITVQLGSDHNDTVSLPPKGTIILSNYPTAQNQAIANNILQCQPIFDSEGDLVPGQFPEGAIDGASSTLWQAASINTTNTLTVDLTDAAFAPVDHMYFDWAAAPAASLSVIFHNSSGYTEAPEGTGLARIDVNGITPSIPYDPSQGNIVQSYVGNTTNISLADQDIWTGKYATLIVTGNTADDSATATAASVAEWAVIVKS
ncbi:glycosyl hydrolase family 65 central catalytic domain-containing protein [Xylariaceae sp. FL0255]|nr:glycosyl hydrolase family 65 central catalytic domain-containing protein [Xylariaceae sp. FL0255]